MYAIILIGVTGSGTTYLAHYITSIYKKFVLFRKVTTREKRKHETDGIDYCFVSELEFQELVKNEKILHTKVSDFDSNMYGVGKEELNSIIEINKYPIFTSHGIEEAQSLKCTLNRFNINAICVYVYSNEIERKNILIKNGERDKYNFRNYIDLTLKIQSYQQKYYGCDYFIFNNYDGHKSISEVDKIALSIEKNVIAKNFNFEYISKQIEKDIQRIKEQISKLIS